MDMKMTEQDLEKEYRKDYEWFGKPRGWTYEEFRKVYHIVSKFPQDVMQEAELLSLNMKEE